MILKNIPLIITLLSLELLHFYLRWSGNSQAPCHPGDVSLHPTALTHHGILRVRLLVVHLPDLLVGGRVHLTQHAEPLAVGRRKGLSRRGQLLDWQHGDWCPSPHSLWKWHFLWATLFLICLHSSWVHVGFMLSMGKGRKNSQSAFRYQLPQLRSTGDPFLQLPQTLRRWTMRKMKSSVPPETPPSRTFTEDIIYNRRNSQVPFHFLEVNSKVRRSVTPEHHLKVATEVDFPCSLPGWGFQPPDSIST